MQIILFLSLCLFSLPIFAETCPSVDEIKKPTLVDWKVVDSEDGKPLSAKRAARFKANAREFALAEWTDNGRKTNFIHCYYRDSTGSNLEAYLAKKNFLPENSKDHWYQVSGAMQCAAGYDKCEFNSLVMNQARMAKK